MKKIVLVNAHWSNRGDEAAIRAIVDGILEHVHDAHITIIFKEAGDIAQFPYTERVDYVTSKFLPKKRNIVYAILSRGKYGCNAEMKKITDTVRGADLVVYAPGGAVISDRFWWRKQLEYLFPIAYAIQKKIPVFFAAPSIGPFYIKHIFRSHILRKVNTICVREEISYYELEKQGLQKNTYVTIDSAFLNQIDTRLNEEQFSQYVELRAFMSSYTRIIGVTITDLSWHVQYGKDATLKKNILETFQQFITQLDREGVGVLLIPQLFGNQNDMEALKKYQTGNTFILNDDKDAYFQQYVIAMLYGVVGMRYHSNIFAAKGGVPFIPIIYEEKMDGFVEAVDWRSLSLWVNELSFDELMKKYSYLTEHYAGLASKLNSKEKEWRDKALQTQEKLLELLR